MQIRSIEREDLDVRYFQLLSELSPSLLNTEENFDRLWSEFVDNNDHHIVVAVSDSYVLGTASLLIERKISGKSAGHIEDVVVSKTRRGLGTGGMLIKKLVEIAKKKNCYKIILNCSDENIPFYSKLGFIKTDNGMKLVV